MWLYKGKEVVDDDIVDSYVGFIYMITQKSTGKLYIGKKLLTSAGTKTINGKKKKIRKMSDWKTYWSSSPTIKDIIKEHGTNDFEREILVFCSSKGSMLYNEELALYMVGALESDKWLNSNIRSKVYSNWVKPDESNQLRQIIKSKLLII